MEKIIFDLADNENEEEARKVLESTVRDSDRAVIKFKPFPDISAPVVKCIAEEEPQVKNLVVRHKIGSDNIPAEMTQPQIMQLDDIDNATHELCKIMLNNADLNWDMSIIGDVADAVAEVLVKKGLKVYFPAMVEDPKTGETRIVDYYGE